MSAKEKPCCHYYYYYLKPVFMPLVGGYIVEGAWGSRWGPQHVVERGKNSNICLFLDSYVSLFDRTSGRQGCWNRVNISMGKPHLTMDVTRRLKPIYVMNGVAVCGLPTSRSGSPMGEDMFSTVSMSEMGQ